MTTTIERPPASPVDTGLKRAYARELVGYLREYFPNPIARPAIGTHYCVIWSLWYAIDPGWNGFSDAVDTWVDDNHLAFPAILKITAPNDGGDFEAAWQALEDALAYPE